MAQASSITLCVHCDLENMTVGQGHDTSLGNGKQLSEILFRSNITVISYGMDKDYSYQYSSTVTLTLEIKPYFRVTPLTLGHGQQLCEILF